MTWKVTVGLAESNGSISHGLGLSHFCADCLESGISFGPNVPTEYETTFTFTFNFNL